jgi:hypothetical protein
MGPGLVGEKQNCLHKEYDQLKKNQSHPHNFTGNIYGKSLVDKPKSTEREMRLRRKTPPKKSISNSILKKIHTHCCYGFKHP